MYSAVGPSVDQSVTWLPGGSPAGTRRGRSSPGTCCQNLQCELSTVNAGRVVGINICGFLGLKKSIIKNDFMVS